MQLYSKSQVKPTKSIISLFLKCIKCVCVCVRCLFCCREATEAHVTPFTPCKRTGPSLKCFIYSVVCPSNYNSSQQALSFPHSHRLSHCDVEGAVVLKVGQSEHLTSFPDTLLGLFHKSLLIGVHLKKRVEGGRLLTDKRVEGRGDQRSLSVQAEKRAFGSTTLDCSQS